MRIDINASLESLRKLVDDQPTPRELQAEAMRRDPGAFATEIRRLDGVHATLARLGAMDTTLHHLDRAIHALRADLQTAEQD